MKLVKWSAFAVFTILIGGALIIGYSWFLNKDPQGEENSNCHLTKLKAVPNKTGMVATAYNTVCDVSGGNSAIYVHVHGLNQDDTRKSLVFRYFDKVEVPPPTIEWINDSSLRISVEAVSQVTKQLPMVDGVEITYEIGKQDYQQ
jgi:hypothetical protein